MARPLPLNDKYAYYNGYVYEISPKTLDWDKALDYCKAKGGTLAYHNLESLTARRFIARGLKGGDRHPGSVFYGVEKSSGTWRTVDGDQIPAEDVHLDSDFTSYYMHRYTYRSAHVATWNFHRADNMGQLTHSTSYSHCLCEYPC